MANPFLGHVVKNWKHRYFRLQGENLFYFEDLKSKKPKGALLLKGATITALPNRVRYAVYFYIQITRSFFMKISLVYVCL